MSGSYGLVVYQGRYAQAEIADPNSYQMCIATQRSGREAKHLDVSDKILAVVPPRYRS